MKKMETTVILKGGITIQFLCDTFKLERNRLSGEIVGWSVKGASSNAYPLYIKPEEIIAVVTADKEVPDNA